MELTAVEFSVLEILLRAAGTVVRRDELARGALGRGLMPFDRSLDVHVSRLRKKLGPRADGGERIRALRAVGYLYAEETHDRGMFLKMVLWFWASLVLVALALHAAVIATSIPTEVRVQRFSDTALAGYGRRAVSILEGEGVPALAAYLQHLESQTRIHAVLIDESGRDATGHPVTPGVIAAARRADEPASPRCRWTAGWR